MASYYTLCDTLSSILMGLALLHYALMEFRYYVARASRYLNVHPTLLGVLILWFPFLKLIQMAGAIFQAEYVSAVAIAMPYSIPDLHALVCLASLYPYAKIIIPWSLHEYAVLVTGCWGFFLLVILDTGNLVGRLAAIIMIVLIVYLSHILWHLIPWQLLRNNGWPEIDRYDFSSFDDGLHNTYRRIEVPQFIQHPRSNPCVNLILLPFIILGSRFVLQHAISTLASELGIPSVALGIVVLSIVTSIPMNLIGMTGLIG